MFRRVGKMILPTHDVADLHLDVVHHVDEMEYPRAVGAANGHVGIRFRVRQVDFDVAADRVFDHDLLAVESETDRTLIVVNPTGGAQLLQITSVDFLALTLEIRSEIV